MNPEKNEDALVDLLDVLLRDGAVVRADVVVSVAEVPLVGIKLSAAVAGMETMTEYGLFEQWDAERRAAAVARRQYGRRRGVVDESRSDSSDRGAERSPAIESGGTDEASTGSREGEGG